MGSLALSPLSEGSSAGKSKGLVRPPSKYEAVSPSPHPIDSHRKLGGWPGDVAARPGTHHRGWPCISTELHGPARVQLWGLGADANRRHKVMMKQHIAISTARSFAAKDSVSSWRARGELEETFSIWGASMHPKSRKFADKLGIARIEDFEIRANHATPKADVLTCLRCGMAVPEQGSTGCQMCSRPPAAFWRPWLAA